MTGAPHRTVRLSFTGDELDPSIITDRLGGEPTRAVRVGDLLQTAGGLAPAVKNLWELRLPVDDDPESMPTTISSLFDGLTRDLDVWNDLVTRYGGWLHYTIPMARPVDGAGLPREVVRAIAERGLGFSLSVYHRAPGMF